MEQAINAYYKITASPEFRELERMRERARLDEASALHHAEMKGHTKGREEGRAEGRKDTALRMLVSRKFSLEEIADFSSLPLEEIKKLQKKILS